MNERDTLSKREAKQMHHQLITEFDVTCATIWHTHPHYRDVILGVLMRYVHDHATDAELYEMKEDMLKRTHRAKLAHMLEVK